MPAVERSLSFGSRNRIDLNFAANATIAAMMPPIPRRIGFWRSGSNGGVTAGSGSANSNAAGG